MKNVLKFLTLGLIFATIGATSVTSTFAQASVEDCGALYDKFLADRPAKDIPGMERAVAAGNEYLEKCKETEGQKEELVPYVNRQLARIKENLKFDLEERDYYKPFREAFESKNTAKIIESGKKILILQPDYVDLLITLASVGYDEARKGVDTYNTDTVNFAKTALQKINEGKPSVPIEGKYPNGAWGMYSYISVTQKCTDGKTNAIGWMNYIVGYINYYRLKNLKDSVPYLYKASQVGCETKEVGDIYRMIGSWYIEEFKRLDDERDKLIKATVTEEAPNGVETDETKALLALQKGYMERIVDAYVRGANLPTTSKEDKDRWLAMAKQFYGFRFKEDMSGYNAWVANSTSKPFADPTSAVTPVAEEPTTATTP